MKKKRICIVTPCYNEEANVQEVYRQVKEQFKKLPGYQYHHIFIDNASKDRTVSILKDLASKDKNVRIIVNSRNFGPLRSPYHGLLEADGDAVILLVADLQDPPEMIPKFIEQWEAGFKVVLGIKTSSAESWFMFLVRKFFYYLIGVLSDTTVQLTKNNTGFGLYDRQIIQILRGLKDANPYLRGMISELGFPSAKIPYKQPARAGGKSSHNFYVNYDFAMQGIVNHSKLPLRMATFSGFLLSGLCALVALGYLVAKLLFWTEFQLGIAPLVVGVFLFASVQLFFIGILGEYIGAIHTQVLKRPLVIEKERVNFD